MEKSEQSSELILAEEPSNQSLVHSGSDSGSALSNGALANSNRLPPVLEAARPLANTEASTVGAPEAEAEWSPEKDEVALGVAGQKETITAEQEVIVVADYDDADDEDEEMGEEEEDDHLYSEGSDVEGVDSGAEYTDYENEEMVQYQAAVEVRAFISIPNLICYLMVNAVIIVIMV